MSADVEARALTLALRPRSAPDADAAVMELFESWQRALAQHAELPEEWWDANTEASSKAERAMLNTPAQTPDGLLAKLTIVRWHAEDDRMLLDSVIADLERLRQRAA